MPRDHSFPTRLSNPGASRPLSLPPIQRGNCPAGQGWCTEPGEGLHIPSQGAQALWGRGFPGSTPLKGQQMWVGPKRMPQRKPCRLKWSLPGQGHTSAATSLTPGSLSPRPPNACRSPGLSQPQRPPTGQSIQKRGGSDMTFLRDPAHLSHPGFLFQMFPNHWFNSPARICPGVGGMSIYM